MTSHEIARLINQLTGNQYSDSASFVTLKLPVTLEESKVATALRALELINSLFSYVTRVEGLTDIPDSELNGELQGMHITVTGVRK